MRYAMLLCAALAATALGPEAAEPADASLAAWNDLQTEYQAAMNEYFRPWREARAKGEEYQLDGANHPNKTYGAKFKEFAAAHEGTEGAAKALVFVLRVGTKAEQDEALHALLQDYIGMKAMKDAAGSLRYRDDGAAALRTIAAKSPHAEVRGFAWLTLGQALKETDPEGAFAARETVAKEYADHPWYRGTLGEKAEGDIFEVKNLSVGQTAPDIEGEDVNGVPFKLSDYRGKVVLLDFWGDW